MPWNFQIPQREEMAAAQETPDRVGQEERLEGLLGMPEGHYPPLLPLRLPGEQSDGGGA